MTYYLILITGTLLGAVASFFFKKASGSDQLVRTLLEPGLYIGGMLYLLSAFIDIYVLRHLEYSVVLPFTSITYIWTMLLACGILKEKATKKKIAGVGLIIAGAILVAI